MSRKRANLHVPIPVRTRVATLSPNPGGSPDPLDSIPRGPTRDRDSSPADAMSTGGSSSSDTQPQSNSTDAGRGRGRPRGRGRGRGRGGGNGQTDRSNSTNSNSTSTRITRITSSSRSASVSPIKSSIPLPLPLTSPADQGRSQTPRFPSRYTSTSPDKATASTQDRPGLATRSSSRSISPIKKTSTPTNLKPSRYSSPVKQSRSTSPVKVATAIPIQDSLQQRLYRKQANSKQVESIKRKSSELPPDDDLSSDEDEKEQTVDIDGPMQKRRKVEEEGQNSGENDEEESRDGEIRPQDKAEDNMVKGIFREEEENLLVGADEEGKDNDSKIATRKDIAVTGDEGDQDLEIAPSPDLKEENGVTDIEMPLVDNTASQLVETGTEGGNVVTTTAEPDITQDGKVDGAEPVDEDEETGEKSTNARVDINSLIDKSSLATNSTHGADLNSVDEPVAASPIPVIEESATTDDNILPAATLGPIQAAQPDNSTSEIATPEVSIGRPEKRPSSGENEVVIDEQMDLDKQDAEVERIAADGEVQESITEFRVDPLIPNTSSNLEETAGSVAASDIVIAQEPSSVDAVEEETTGGDGQDNVDVLTGGRVVEQEESITTKKGTLSQAVGADAEEESELTDIKQTIDAKQGMDVDLPVFDTVESEEIAPVPPVEESNGSTDRSTNEVDIEISVNTDEKMDVDVDTTVFSVMDVPLAVSAKETASSAVEEDDRHQSIPAAVEQKQQRPEEVNVPMTEEGDEGEEEIEQDQEQEEEMSATPIPAPTRTASPAKSSTSVATTTTTTTTTGKGKNNAKAKKVAVPKKAITASNKKIAGGKGKKTKVEEIKGGGKGRSSSISERSQTPQPQPNDGPDFQPASLNTNSPSKNSPSKSAAAGAGGAAYCICRKLYEDDDEDVTWLGCESCDGWFHASCAGIKEEMVKLLDVFICKKCERTTAQRTIYKKVCKREMCSKSIDGLNSKFCSPSCAFRHSTALISGLNNKNTLKGLAKSFIAFPQPHLGVSVVQHQPSQPQPQSQSQSSTNMNTEEKSKIHEEAIKSLRSQIQVVDSALEILKKREEIFRVTLEKSEDLQAVAIQVDGEEKKKKGRGRGRVAVNGGGEGGGLGKDDRACGWASLLIADDDYIREYQLPIPQPQNEEGHVEGDEREICLMPRRKCDRHQGWQKTTEKSLETEQKSMIVMRDKLNERISNLELEYQNQQSSSEARTLFAARGGR